jgi:hypothetical protein
MEHMTNYLISIWFRVDSVTAGDYWRGSFLLGGSRAACRRRSLAPLVTLLVSRRGKHNAQTRCYIWRFWNTFHRVIWISLPCSSYSINSMSSSTHVSSLLCLSLILQRIYILSELDIVNDTSLTYGGESVIIHNVCFIFIKTRAEILQLHNFPTQSPCFTMHSVHHHTISFMTSE